ncbi:unnamed protein product, partial [marine sediment metagenome]
MGIKSSAFGGISKAEAAALDAVVKDIAENHADRHPDGGADPLAAPVALAAIPDAVFDPLTGLLFKAYLATGTADYPNGINDGALTISEPSMDMVGEYCEIDFHMNCKVNEFRHFGNNS